MNLQEFFKENPKVALAFSGGVDSSYLLYAAMKYGADVKAYYVKALFQPQFEMDDAMRLAEQLKAPVRVLRADVLSDPVVVSNPSNRCYYCKKVIFNMIMKAAAEDGYTVLLDGTNASDDAGDRPGMKALQELQVKSPLRECGLVKSEIRRLSKEGGLLPGTSRHMHVWPPAFRPDARLRQKSFRRRKQQRIFCSPLDSVISVCG